MIKTNLIDLLTSIQSKTIRFKAWSTNSYKETTLHLENNGVSRVFIDITRYGVTNYVSQTQIIGLSHPVESEPENHILLLEPKQEKAFILTSRCLNKKGKPPETGTEYELVPKLLAGYVIELLRRGANQSEVWESVNAHKGEILQRLQISAMIDTF